MGNQDLTRLLERVAIGDRAAFHRLYDQTNAKLFAVCLRILGDRGEAEDALQDAYVKIWRYAERFTAARASPMTWMLAIARNLSIDRLRAKRPPDATLERAERVADATVLADRKMMARDEAKRLSDCIDALGDPSARLVRVAYFGGATYAALAERDSVPLGTIKSRMRRALQALRECLS